jgi:AcrR family transcriptional regulator
MDDGEGRMEQVPITEAGHVMSSEINVILGEPHPTRADAVRNRALLLETAKRLFAEQGVSQVTMTDIQEAAQVGKGTLYRHFKDKNELCLALLDEDQRALQARTLAHMSEEADAHVLLHWFLEVVLAFIDQNQEMLCTNTQPVGSLQHPAHWWWRQTIHALLLRLQPQGDLDLMADTLYTLIDVHNLYYLRAVRGYSLSRVTEHVQRLADQMVGI